MLSKHLLWLPALLSMIGSSASPYPDVSETALAPMPRAELTTHFVRLHTDRMLFSVLIAASADIYNLPEGLKRVEILVGAGFEEARAPSPGTLLLVPVFLHSDDPRLQPDMPAWIAGGWAWGERSTHAMKGVSAVSILDALLRYLDQGSSFAELREVDLISGGSEAKLLQLLILEHIKDPPQFTRGFELRYRLEQRTSSPNEHE
ncbi:hypothetical protein [Ectopseudomonas toyotomiensis]|uniref:hypothetical protein n=1 Tax=Ectopseudomonas toyotomiensis TaxID=554344 RepID=UPI003D1470A5